MYLPSVFEMSESRQTEMLLSARFATLIATIDSKLEATPIPILVSLSPLSVSLSPLSIEFHLSLNNPLCELFSLQDSKALLIVNGVDAYISPEWYEDPGVPTWNYEVLHLHGLVKKMEKQELVIHLDKLTSLNEGGKKLSKTVDGEQFNNRLDQIEGFRMSVESTEGKSKLSQNKSVQDRKNIVYELSLKDPNSQCAQRMLKELSRDIDYQS